MGRKAEKEFRACMARRVDVQRARKQRRQARGQASCRRSVVTWKRVIIAMRSTISDSSPTSRISCFFVFSMDLVVVLVFNARLIRVEVSVR